MQYTRASVNNLDYDIGGVNLEWAINPHIAVFGRYGFGSIKNRGTLLATTLPTLINAASTATNLSPSTFSAGLAFPNLFKQGALAAIAVGQPFIESNVGNSTQTNVEAFYNFPITENISITPDLQFICNPNNNSSNGTITVGTVRAVFSF
jgi:Carbohydrate-selective porin, OprB family